MSLECIITYKQVPISFFETVYPFSMFKTTKFLFFCDQDTIIKFKVRWGKYLIQEWRPGSRFPVPGSSLLKRRLHALSVSVKGSFFKILPPLTPMPPLLTLARKWMDPLLQKLEKEEKNNS